MVLVKSRSRRVVGVNRVDWRNASLLVCGHVRPSLSLSLLIIIDDSFDCLGMRKEWILTEEEKVNKKKRIEENRRSRVSPNEDSPTGAESVAGGSSRDQRTPSEKPDTDLQRVLLNKNERPPLKSVTSIHNGDIISNVVSAFRDGFQLDPTSYGWSYPLARKITALCQILNTKNTTALRLISSYKRLHEFDSLNDMDKVNLVKSNLRYMFFFHGSLG